MQALLTSHEDDVHDFLSVFAPDLAKFKIPELHAELMGRGEVLERYSPPNRDWILILF